MLCQLIERLVKQRRSHHNIADQEKSFLNYAHLLMKRTSAKIWSCVHWGKIKNQYVWILDVFNFSLILLGIWRSIYWLRRFSKWVPPPNQPAIKTRKKAYQLATCAKISGFVWILACHASKNFIRGNSGLMNGMWLLFSTVGQGYNRFSVNLIPPLFNNIFKKVSHLFQKTQHKSFIKSNRFKNTTIWIEKG